jgi:hypothetical protein
VLCDVHATKNYEIIRHYSPSCTCHYKIDGDNDGKPETLYNEKRDCMDAVCFFVRLFWTLDARALLNSGGETLERRHPKEKDAASVDIEEFRGSDFFPSVTSTHFQHMKVTLVLKDFDSGCCWTW